jgi:DNA polymerase-3 subunit alpha
VLGLRTLGVLEDSGVQVDWYHLPLNDPKVLKVLNDRRFAGIFQFEGLSLQSITGDGQISVESLEDIGHITAIARPGPMASGGATLYINRRNGKVEYRTPHPVMDKYVKDTFGVVIYQEQVIQICREVGKLNWEDTTSIRKAMSGRLGVEFFNKFQSVFTKGAAEEGVDEAAAKEIWSQINTMGSWAFNLAHSYSYAVVSYWTAWLKAYHLLEFAAGNASQCKGR